MPTVVGEMMPFRFGYCWSRASVWLKLVWSSSLPYAILTSCIFGYFVSSCFMKPIQVFWFVAVLAAERIAIWPVLLICWASRSTSLVPICVLSAWLTKTVRASGSTSESKLTTLMPWAIACLRAGATALGSSPEMTMALTCCSVSVVIKGICAAALALDGPTCWNFPFRSFAASWPPEAAVVKYGLLTCLGRNAILSEAELAPGVPPPPVLPPPPQAVSASRASTMRPGISVRNSFLTVFSSLYLSRTTRGQAPAGYGNLNAPGDIGSQHREDEQQPDGEALNIPTDVQQAQNVLNSRHDKDGEHNSQQRPGAAEDIDASQQHDRYYIQFEAQGIIGPGAGDARRKDDPRQGSQQAGDDKQNQLRALHVDSGEARGLLVIAHRVELAAQAAEVQHHSKDQSQNGKDQARPGNLAARNGTKAQVGKGSRKIAHRLVPQHDIRQAAEERQAANRHHQGGQTEPGDEHAVERAGQHADQQRYANRQPQRMAGLPDQAQHHTGQAQHRGYRQVDLTDDDDQRHGQRHYGDLHDIAGQCVEVKPGQKIGREHAAEHATGREQDHQQGFPGKQQ